jgi:hypothetical protein
MTRAEKERLEGSSKGYGMGQLQAAPFMWTSLCGPGYMPMNG